MVLQVEKIPGRYRIETAEDGEVTTTRKESRTVWKARKILRNCWVRIHDALAQSNALSQPEWVFVLSSSG